MHGQQSYGVIGTPMTGQLSKVEPQRQPEVLRELERQDSVLVALETSAAELEKRMHEVLAPCAPQPGNTQNAPQAVSNCGLGSRLKDHNNRMGAVIERIGSLMQRLEV